MALQKQVLPIDLGQGVDTKTDPKKIVIGRLKALKNGLFKKLGRIDKRNGYMPFGNETVDSLELSKGDSLATFRDELLQYHNNEKLYSYSPSSEKWINKGSVVSAIVKSQAIIQNTAEQTQVDSAINNGVSVYAWADSRGGIRASVFDENTGTTILSDQLIDGAASRVRCLAFSNYLFVFYYKSGGLYVRRINPLSPSSFDTAVQLASDINTTNPNYDVSAYKSLRVMFAYNVQGSTATKVAWMSDAPAVLSGSLAAVTIAEASTRCIAIVQGASNRFFIAYQNNTNGVRCTILNNGAGTLFAPFTVENITASNVVNITGYILPDASGVRFFYEIAAAATYNQVIRQNTATNNGTVGAATDFLRSVGLHSKAFTYRTDDDQESSYVAIVYESPFQATYFVARSDGLIVAKQQYSVARGLTGVPILQNVWQMSDAIFNYAILKKSRIVSENATLFTPTSVAKTSLDFTNDDVFTYAQLGNNTHIVGGVLSMYDGQSVVEHGFHLYPEGFTSTSAATGGSFSNGSDSYVGLYEWTDNYGQIHRSAPSLPFTGTRNSGGSTQKLTVKFPTLRLTSKNGTTRTNVSLVLYRLDLTSGVYYRVTSIAAPTFNSVSDDTVDVVDTGANLTANEILYTQGGILDNFAAPACSAIAVFKNRIWLGGLEDENTVWFSKERKDGSPVEFSDTFKKVMEPEGGKVTSFGILNDKIMLFKYDRFFYSYGDGPNDLGTQGDFAEPEFVTADVGCISATSITRTPDGLMFKTAKGIYALSSALQVDYVGADVEDFNDQRITSATLVADVNQVRFTTADGPTLSYDYLAKQWSTFYNHAAKDSLVWNRKFVLLRNTGAVLYESPEYFKDNKATIPLSLETGWISLAGIVGYQRIYRLFFLGEYKSPHRVRISVAYDFSPAYTSIVEFDPTDKLTITSYGEVSPFGAEETYGGPNSAYRFEVHLKQQKCQSIKFLIEEIITSADTGSQESMNISSIGLIAGLKPGFAKLRAAQKTGAS